MAGLTHNAVPTVSLDATQSEGSLLDWILEPKRFLPGLAVAFMALSWGLRWFQENMSFSVGMDFYEPEFQQIWMPLLYAELAFALTVAVVTFSYIWLTREKDAAAVSPQLELKRYYTLLGFFVVLAIWAIPIGFLGVESDAAWHQVSIRDTDFTPTHIVLFYFDLPFLSIMLIAAFLWAHTRLPLFINRISIPFLIVAGGLFMIMPNYGFNEWGHTFFYAEELFAAPIHYGFVVIGWAFFALVPLLVQIMTRMAQLIPEVAALEDKEEATLQQAA
ncbi:MAG: methane monooxygenase/ammonia monooxygenase subunit C [Gammaproteobacteria bacterium]|nr:MAG: methane monooxygenase/ammonia monooxygenase subunit C [Gammaproteobacteria bacterium]